MLILVLGSFTVLSILWTHQQNQITSLNNEVSTLTANQEATQGPTYYDVTVSPSDKTVYFPLAKLKVADSTLAEGLVYTYTPSYTIPHDSKVFPATLSISTHDLAANAQSTTQQFDNLIVQKLPTPILSLPHTLLTRCGNLMAVSSWPMAER